MSLKHMSLCVATLVCALFMSGSCSTLEVRSTPGKRMGHGPPAHANAHGLRRKQVAGVELIYDSGRRVYVVVGLPNHYYHDGYFYRLHDTEWEMSLQLSGSWALVSEKSLPPGLQAEGKGKQKRAS